jgi:hypothetical protein
MKSDANDMSRSAAQIIAQKIRDDALDDEPYCWGLSLAEVAKQVYDLLKDKHPGREQWAREAMRAGFLSENFGF